AKRLAEESFELPFQPKALHDVCIGAKSQAREALHALEYRVPPLTFSKSRVGPTLGRLLLAPILQIQSVIRTLMAPFVLFSAVTYLLLRQRNQLPAVLGNLEHDHPWVLPALI